MIMMREIGVGNKRFENRFCFLGEAADGWIRGQIDAQNLRQSNALFPMEHWNMIDRLAEGHHC